MNEYLTLCSFFDILLSLYYNRAMHATSREVPSVMSQVSTVSLQTTVHVPATQAPGESLQPPSYSRGGRGWSSCFHQVAMH